MRKSGPGFRLRFRRVLGCVALPAFVGNPTSLFAQGRERRNVHRLPTIRFSPCPTAADAPLSGRTGERWPGGRPTLVQTYLRRANAEMQRLTREATGRVATEIEAVVGRGTALPREFGDVARIVREEVTRGRVASWIVADPQSLLSYDFGTREIRAHTTAERERTQNVGTLTTSRLFHEGVHATHGRRFAHPARFYDAARPFVEVFFSSPANPAVRSNRDAITVVRLVKKFQLWTEFWAYYYEDWFSQAQSNPRATSTVNEFYRAIWSGNTVNRRITGHLGTVGGRITPETWVPPAVTCPEFRDANAALGRLSR